MGFFQVFINRPIMATAVNLVLLIIGLIAFDRLELRHAPDSARNEFTICTHYHGANSMAVEQRVTNVLEDSLSGLDGIKKLSSESSDGHSHIHIKFKSNVTRQYALSELRDRVFSSMNSLPDSVKRAEIQEAAEGDKAILNIAFEDKTRSTAALSDYIRRVIEDRLRLIEGVSKVEYWGDKLYQVAIQLDPALLMEHHVSAEDVVHAIKHEKPFASGGEIEKESGKKTVVLSAALTAPQEYGDIIVRATKEGSIRVKDVAQVKVIDKSTFLRMRVDGQPMVVLAVSAKPQSNPLQVANRVRGFVEELQQSIPNSMKMVVSYDSTVPFQASITSVKNTLWEAIILVGIIVTLSLGSVRAALFPMITVPLCLIGSFALMWIFGFSVNPITLLALVLAVGLVVDDAIVVVENIHRHMEEGLSPLQAARKGMKEITFAVIVMTITLAAVYMPIAFQADDTAVMFKEFAWTLAGSVIISGFVALTLTPALCGQFLKQAKKVSTWDKLTDYYQNSLGKAIKHPKAIYSLAVIVALFGVWGYAKLPSELKPAEDEDFIHGYFDFSNTVPDAVRTGWFDEVEKILKTIPEGTRVATGDWQQRWVWWNLLLKPRAERSRNFKQISEEIGPKLAQIVGPRVGINMGEGGGMDGDESLKVILQYAAPYERVIKLVKAIMEEAETKPEFQRLSSEETWDISRIKVDVDRPLAQELGVHPEMIEDTLYTLLAGNKANIFNFQGFDYDVLVQASLPFRSQQQSLNQFFVSGSEGQWIPLGSLVNIKEVIEPQKLKHYERIRGAAISIVPNASVSLEQAIKTIEPIIQKHLPVGASYRFAGTAEKYQESKQAIWLTYGLSLIFIYLVLAALFESFMSPFVVLLTVPLSIAGAMWAVNAFGGTNNIYTSIGLVTLIGLITKHGILIVDFANRLTAKGMPLVQAVQEAAAKRLRPVLMTTLAMVFGAVPLVFSIGAFANARIHIGWVIIGGMICGTIFSLYVVPVVYVGVRSRIFNRVDELEVQQHAKGI
jgi:multidrug efflux pump